MKNFEANHLRDSLARVLDRQQNGDCVATHMQENEQGVIINVATNKHSYPYKPHDVLPNKISGLNARNDIVSREAMEFFKYFKMLYQNRHDNNGNNVTVENEFEVKRQRLQRLVYDHLPYEPAQYNPTIQNQVEYFTDFLIANQTDIFASDSEHQDETRLSGNLCSKIKDFTQNNNSARDALNTINSQLNGEALKTIRGFIKLEEYFKNHPVQDAGLIYAGTDTHGYKHHAEQKLLLTLLQQGYLEKENAEQIYLGISRLCCGDCDLYIQAFNEVLNEYNNQKQNEINLTANIERRGTHHNIYDKTSSMLFPIPPRFAAKARLQTVEQQNGATSIPLENFSNSGVLFNDHDARYQFFARLVDKWFDKLNPEDKEVLKKRCKQQLSSENSKEQMLTEPRADNNQRIQDRRYPYETYRKKNTANRNEIQTTLQQQTNAGDSPQPPNFISEEWFADFSANTTHPYQTTTNQANTVSDNNKQHTHEQKAHERLQKTEHPIEMSQDQRTDDQRIQDNLAKVLDQHQAGDCVALHITSDRKVYVTTNNTTTPGRKSVKKNTRKKNESDNQSTSSNQSSEQSSNQSSDQSSADVKAEGYQQHILRFLDYFQNINKKGTTDHRAMLERLLQHFLPNAYSSYHPSVRDQLKAFAHFLDNNRGAIFPLADKQDETDLKYNLSSVIEDNTQVDDKEGIRAVSNLLTGADLRTVRGFFKLQDHFQNQPLADASLLCLGEQKNHAEQKLLLYLLESGYLEDVAQQKFEDLNQVKPGAATSPTEVYLGISKQCCLECYHYIKAFNQTLGDYGLHEIKIGSSPSGTHNKLTDPKPRFQQLGTLNNNGQKLRFSNCEVKATDHNGNFDAKASPRHKIVDNSNAKVKGYSSRSDFLKSFRKSLGVQYHQFKKPQDPKQTDIDLQSGPCSPPPNPDDSRPNTPQKRARPYKNDTDDRSGPPSAKKARGQGQHNWQTVNQALVQSPSTFSVFQNQTGQTGLTQQQKSKRSNSVEDTMEDENNYEPPSPGTGSQSM